MTFWSITKFAVTPVSSISIMPSELLSRITLPVISTGTDAWDRSRRAEEAAVALRLQECVDLREYTRRQGRTTPA
jgi:hypothetical protein